MECEVKKEGKGDDGITSPLLISILEEQIKTATDQLLLTNFSACLETCRHVAASVNFSGDFDADSDTVKRLGKVREEATVIGIQALAEQGSWKDVIPFVEQVYTQMAASPATIMQMCLLLYAHVREYMVCHSLINSWLEWDDHHSQPESGAIVAIYVTNVLVPLRAYNLIPQVVEKCKVLSSEERQALLSPNVGSPRRRDENEDKAVPVTDDTANGSSIKNPDDEKGHGDRPKGIWIISMYLNVAKRLWRHFAKRGWCQQIRRASKLFFLISFVLLALLHVQTDVVANFSRAMELWKTAMSALHSMWKRQPRRHL